MQYLLKRKPPLRWAGGKSHLVGKIKSLVPAHKLWSGEFTYVDLFCGGLSIPFALQPKNAILSDLNNDLINFYAWIQGTGGKVTENFEDSKSFFQNVRQKFNQRNSDESLSAQYFYYLIKTCANGLCRYNKSGEFNTPYGGRDGKTVYRENFVDVQELVSSWGFYLSDFEEMLRCLLTAVNGNKKFFYIDPPFEGVFSSYTKNGFNFDNQATLAKILSRLDAPVIASNSNDPKILDLYKNLGFSVEIIECPRRINFNGDRTPALEMFATKNLHLINADIEK